jgi:ketosteroid isomerase-like protein
MEGGVLERARAGFEAWQQGDLQTIEAILDPKVTWKWWESGEWDCYGREEVINRLAQRIREGFNGAPLEVEEAGPNRVLVVSHPALIGGPEWPEEVATLIEFRGGRAVSMQDFPSRSGALAAAALPSS